MDKVEAKQRSAMIAVIECWKRNRCLWDPTNPNWNNIDARNKAYKSVLMLYRKLDPSASLLTAKKKLSNMKASYKKEYRKVKRCQSVKGREDAYVPKLWYYKHLLFLDKGVTSNGRGSVGRESYEKDIRRKSKSSSGGNNSMVSQQTAQEEVFVQQQAQETASAHTEEAKPKELLVDNINTPLTSKECEWEIIAKSIGLQLKNLESQQQDIAHKLISDIIFYGKRGKLSESTAILIEPHHPPPHFRSAHVFDPLRASNCHSGMLSPQSICYRPHTPSSSISSPPIVSSQSDYRFSPTTSQRHLQRPGTQPAVLPLETTFHHTHVEEGPICVEVTASSEMKQEEISISDNEDSDGYVFYCS